LLLFTTQVIFRRSSTVSSWEDYLQLIQDRPDLFVNPSGAAFEILLDEAQIHLAEEQSKTRLTEDGLPPEWATVGIAYQDQYLFLLRDAVRYVDGSLGTYIRFVGPADKPSGVMILPVFQGKILLIRHFRHATRTSHLEFPAGAIEADISAEECARRELAEEIGGSASRLINLGHLHSDVGMSGAFLDLFYAEVEHYGPLDTLEGISEVVGVTPAEFEDLVRRNDITAAETIAAFTCAKVQQLF
jgi:ADP-ribose pyrophosphatase